MIRIVGDIGNLAAKGGEGYSSSKVLHTSTKELDISYSRNGSRYIKLDGKESEKLVPTQMLGKTSKDYRSFLYLNNNGLYLKRFKGNKLKVDEKIDSNVDEALMSLDGSEIAYIKNSDLYYLAKGKKEGIKVDAKDDVVEFDVTNNGKIYYETYDGRLYVTKGKKTGDKIADYVNYSMLNYTDHNLMWN